MFNLQRPHKTRFEYPTSHRHGDIDNHLKTVLDAVNAFLPDAQVCGVEMDKLWAEDGMGAGVLIEVEPYRPPRARVNGHERNTE